VITALLLAAGSAHRFGGSTPKLAMELGGRPVIRWCAEMLAAADVDELLVVVPPEHDAIVAALEGLDFRWVVNDEADRGIGRSIACGVAALGDITRAVLIAPADEPSLSPDVVARVVARYRSARAMREPVAIVAPRYAGVPGHPVLFDRAVFAELRALDGDRGARQVVDGDPRRVAVVDV